MLVLRLQRLGKKGQPHFRIVLQEHTHAVKRKAQEVLGFYKPASDPKEFKIDQDRLKHWISMGARPSDTLAVLLKKEGMEDMDKYIATREKHRKKKGAEEEKPAPATPAAPAAEEKPVEKAPEAPKEEEADQAAPAAEEKPAEEAPETPKEEEAAPAEEEPKSE